MKKMILIAVAAMSIWAAAEEVVTVPTVAVLPFEARERQAESDNAGKSVAELLSVALMERGVAEMVERAELDAAAAQGHRPDIEPGGTVHLRIRAVGWIAQRHDGLEAIAARADEFRRSGQVSRCLRRQSAHVDGDLRRRSSTDDQHLGGCHGLHPGIRGAARHAGVHRPGRHIGRQQHPLFQLLEQHLARKRRRTSALGGRSGPLPRPQPPITKQGLEREPREWIGHGRSLDVLCLTIPCSDLLAHPAKTGCATGRWPRGRCARRAAAWKRRHRLAGGQRQGRRTGARGWPWRLRLHCGCAIHPHAARLDARVF